MTTIDTRLVSAGLCPDGHHTETFDLILGGQVFESAAVVHLRDIYFEPDSFREWLEADHDLLHAVGAALVDALAVRS